jgi:hypothetical protein
MWLFGKLVHSFAGFFVAASIHLDRYDRVFSQIRCNRNSATGTPKNDARTCLPFSRGNLGSFRKRLSLGMPLMLAVIDQLIKENQSQMLRERRNADRTHFVRPVVIQAIRGTDVFQGFTRDISSIGIGVISPVVWEPPAIVALQVHSLRGRALSMTAETRWCEEYGEGWYLVGFAFR